MSRSRIQLVVLAVALLFANCWCAAQCTVTPSPAHLPPCHKHHQAAKLCAPAIAVETAAAIFPSPLAAIAIVPALPDFSGAPVGQSIAHARDLSPPPPLISTPILA